MGYNIVTRRKSVSLSSLGIHVPVTHAARAAANRSSPNGTAHKAHGASPQTSSATEPPSPSLASSPSSDHHPSKKIKRSHRPGSQSALSPKKLPPTAARLETTPPPSPPARHQSVEMDADAPAVRKINMDEIRDEIVEAVVLRLQDTANRPHLVKELAAVLMQQLKIVQQSANPCAIISSRLATYLKRQCWTASAPCPLAKELETVHPRRTYFYLTTCLHQPLPDPSTSQFISRTIITPPLSNSTSGSDDADEERRRELSPSPEVDLSSPEFDDMDDDIPMPSTPIGSFSGRHPGAFASQARHHRSTSPPLEKDEKEFTQTAEGLLQKRKLSGDLLSVEPVSLAMDLDDGGRDESLFGGESKSLAVNLAPQMMLVTSPAIRPTFPLNIRKDGEADSWSKLDTMLEWDRSPENVELDELDGLLNGF